MLCIGKADALVFGLRVGVLWPESQTTPNCTGVREGESQRAGEREREREKQKRERTRGK